MTLGRFHGRVEVVSPTRNNRSLIIIQMPELGSVETGLGSKDQAVTNSITSASASMDLGACRQSDQCNADIYPRIP